jgi:hypothetical protein
MARRIKKARINHISLVPRGANAMPVFYKSEGNGTGRVQFDMLTKAADDFDEKGELLAVVYAPEVRDSQGDIASAEVIKEMAYEFARSGKGIDVRHDGESLPKDKAFVAENFIVQKGDPRFENFKDYNGDPVDVTGAWATVIKIEDESLRKNYREGKWNGVSMGGTGEVEVEKESDFIEKLLKVIDKHKDIDMKPEELAALLKQNNEALVAALTKELKPSEEKKADALVEPNAGESLAEYTARVTKEAPDAKASDILAVFEKSQTKPNAPKKPIFKGDPMKVEDVKAHQLALKKWELSKDVDWEDPESVAKYEKSLNAFIAEQDGEIEKEEDFATDRERELAAENARLRKASNQGGGDGGKDTEPLARVTGMNKEDNDLFAAGASWGKLINKQRAG